MPTLRGTLAIKRFSLPRWFGFARDLPPGVQVALDNLSGKLPFELTPQKFVVSSGHRDGTEYRLHGRRGRQRFFQSRHCAAPCNQRHPLEPGIPRSGKTRRFPRRPIKRRRFSEKTIPIQRSAMTSIWKLPAPHFGSGRATASPSALRPIRQTKRNRQKSPSAALHCTADRYKAISSPVTSWP